MPRTMSITRAKGVALSLTVHVTPAAAAHLATVDPPITDQASLEAMAQTVVDGFLARAELAGGEQMQAARLEEKRQEVRDAAQALEEAEVELRKLESPTETPGYTQGDRVSSVLAEHEDG